MASSTHDPRSDVDADDARPTKRRYTRRSEDEQIAELQAQVQRLQARKAASQRKNDPLVREIPKLQRRLRAFAQLAHDEGEPQIANTVLAFQAGLERTLHELMDRPVRSSGEQGDEDALADEA